MNVPVAHSSYARHQAEGLTGRALEAAVLEKCAFEMHALMKRPSVSFEERLKVLERNRSLWSIFVSSVADPASPLPPELKSNIAQLAVFTERQMRKAIAEDTLSALEPIIFINRHLAAGLRGKDGGELPPLN